MMEDYELTDNAGKKQYEFHINGLVPRIEYIKNDTNEIYLTHTEVPVELEGKGIATQLIRKTLEDVKAKKRILIPLCPFVNGYIRRHPEWKEIVKPGVKI